jgi:hypothetical protein
MQSQNFDVCRAVELLEGYHKFLNNVKKMVYKELFQHYETCQ